MYSKTLYAGWGDMDFNSHMRNTAYLDKTADVRQMFLIENGFPMEEFIDALGAVEIFELGLGSVPHLRIVGKLIIDKNRRANRVVPKAAFYGRCVVGIESFSLHC